MTSDALWHLDLLLNMPQFSQTPHLLILTCFSIRISALTTMNPGDWTSRFTAISCLMLTATAQYVNKSLRQSLKAPAFGAEVNMEEITKVVHEFILREFLPGEDPDELSDRSPLITGGVLDSITTLKMVTFLEDRFGITIEAHEAGVDNLDSIDQIAALVARKRNAA
jgi:acyl carrier protein